MRRIKEKYSLQNIDDLKQIARFVPVSKDKIEVKTKFFQLLNPHLSKQMEKTLVLN
ncbi:putative transposase domain protein [Mycoplasmoides gallisepticum str. R(low)]|uniref:Transposase domain protein n=1 Tax=Mycoplasmoides gallisepticum (strain R(low / passage 15 / clone 2)) TaxID=710127 RepID=D3DEI9_MYCGA|nr:putative transposase domain protein [Mycoplasmoides gallisepticum str. R(low)]ADC30461.1 putative transposase domain protein [Mycoplasmoides gallisepticum str. R(high)]